MGVLLIATGERNYGEMAVQLAVSLRLSSKKIPITCVSDGCVQSVMGWNKYIDKIIDVPKSANPFELKTRIYKLTPYSQTLYVDVDTVLLHGHGLQSIMEGFDGVELGMIEYGRHNENAGKVSAWGTTQDIFKHYGLIGEYSVFNSSFIYFRKSHKNRAFFNAANKAYLDPCKEVKLIGRRYPDEVAFAAASCITGHYPDKNLRPIAYFMFRDYYSFNSVQDVRDSYPFISLASSKVPDWMKTLYNGTTARNATAEGLQHYKFQVQKKEAWRMN